MSESFGSTPRPPEPEPEPPHVPEPDPGESGVVTDLPEDADEEGMPLPMEDVPPPPEPMAYDLAEPGIYICAEDNPGMHAILGQLQPGENDFSETTDPRTLAAISALVEAGILERKA